jgi:hypothetical protein
MDYSAYSRGEQPADLAEVIVYEGASYTHFERPATGPKPLSRGGLGKGVGRLETRHFSWKARKAMRAFLGKKKITAIAAGYFSTLKYPGADIDYPVPTTREAKAHLGRLRKRIRRAYPNAAVVWRLEYVVEVPHFHLLVLGGQGITREWLARAWCRCTRRLDTRMVRDGTYYEQVRSVEGVKNYITKRQPDLVQEQNTSETHDGDYWSHFGDFTPYEGTPRPRKVTPDERAALQADLDRKWLAKMAAIPGARGRQAVQAVEKIIRYRSPHTRFTYFDSPDEVPTPTGGSDWIVYTPSREELEAWNRHIARSEARRRR